MSTLLFTLEQLVEAINGIAVAVPPAHTPAPEPTPPAPTPPAPTPFMQFAAAKAMRARERHSLAQCGCDTGKGFTCRYVKSAARRAAKGLPTWPDHVLSAGWADGLPGGVPAPGVLPSTVAQPIAPKAAPKRKARKGNRPTIQTDPEWAKAQAWLRKNNQHFAGTSRTQQIRAAKQCGWGGYEAVRPNSKPEMPVTPVGNPAVENDSKINMFLARKGKKYGSWSNEKRAQQAAKLGYGSTEQPAPEPLPAANRTAMLQEWLRKVAPNAVRLHNATGDMLELTAYMFGYRD